LSGLHGRGSRGVELSRWLGIDDSVTGLWIGGLTVSLILWTIDWFNRKNIRFWGKKIIIALGYYALIVLPLYFLNIIRLSLPRYETFCGCGLNKMLVGIVAGSIAFYIGALTYDILKEKNNGHAHFPFEKSSSPSPARYFKYCVLFFNKVI